MSQKVIGVNSDSDRLRTSLAPSDPLTFMFDLRAWSGCKQRTWRITESRLAQITEAREIAKIAPLLICATLHSGEGNWLLPMVGGNLNTDGTSEFSCLRAFSWIAGNVQDSLGVSVAGKAILRIIDRHHGSE